MPRTYHLVVLPGDGIGPEVIAQALRVLEAAADTYGFGLRTETHAVGGHALELCGDPLPRMTRQACQACDAVLLGAVGGPRWDHETGPRRCEAGLLALRRLLGAFANLRPVVVPPSLGAVSPLRSAPGTDLVIVRELTGGIYFGEPRGIETIDGIRSGANTMRYTEPEVIRIARVAFRLADQRSGRVTSVDKANVLDVSQLWRQTVEQLHDDEFPHVALDHLYVDNAAMQIVLHPTRFDVVLTANLFGDILSDLAATLPGSLGMLPSASVGGGTGLFEPVHGSAPDIAGRGIANPLGAILSGSMLLDALGEGAAAAAIRGAVERVLESSLRTSDLGGRASTAQIADAVLEQTCSPALESVPN